MKSLTPEQLSSERALFEKWYSEKFEWYISRKRRGYCLRLSVHDEQNYAWEHPQQCWETWVEARYFDKE